MGIGLVDIDAKDCMMLRTHQSLSNKELSLRNKTMVDFYISVIKCCQGNYEGDGNGIFYVFIQVTDGLHLSGETNF